jgi:hypothetical protein
MKSLIGASLRMERYGVRHGAAAGWFVITTFEEGGSGPRDGFFLFSPHESTRAWARLFERRDRK